MTRLTLDFEAADPKALAFALRHLADQIRRGRLGESTGHGGEGYKGVTAYDRTPTPGLNS